MSHGPWGRAGAAAFCAAIINTVPIDVTVIKNVNRR
jgi:hypothetical protein